MAGITRAQVLWLGLALLPVLLEGCQAWYPLPNDPIPSTCQAVCYREQTPDWALLPQQSKNHVYIFLLNGNDPFNNGNLLGVRDYLQARGFVKTSYGQQFHGPWFEADILAIREADPLARFILVGYSAAAGLTNRLARRLGDQGLDIDCMVYLDGVFLFNTDEWVKPDTVGRFVNLRSEGWLIYGSEREGAENVVLEGAGHFDVPTHPTTLKVLLQEATAVANQIPITLDVPPPLKAGPRPTPLVHATVHHMPPEWDFLRPDFLSGPWVSISHKPFSTAPKR